MSEVQGQINQFSLSGVLNPEVLETEFHFADGHSVRIPTSLLQYTAVRADAQALPDETDQIVIPVIEEQLEVSKRIVDTGKVRLDKSVETYAVKLDEVLAVKEWQIERVKKHEVISEIPATRQEGETTVYPVVEERLVITKELVLVEEIRVTRSLSERRDTQTIVLRRETINIEREDLSART